MSAPHRNAARRNTAQKSLTLGLIFSLGVASLCGPVEPCAARDHILSTHGAATCACHQACCAEESSGSCCDATPTPRLCECANQRSNPLVPAERQRTTERESLGWVKIVPPANPPFAVATRMLAHPHLAKSFHGSTPRLQVVLCRWLT